MTCHKVMNARRVLIPKVVRRCWCASSREEGAGRLAGYAFRKRKIRITLTMNRTPNVSAKGIDSSSLAAPLVNTGAARAVRQPTNPMTAKVIPVFIRRGYSGVSPNSKRPSILRYWAGLSCG
ncbi:MAG: hypothetical protein ACI9KE_006280 [Polyangiales bacterium]|jgi:hypothetical protein